MHAGFGFSATKHDAAWRWLADRNIEVAFLQEAVAPAWAADQWESIVIAPHYNSRPWGSAIVSKAKLIEHLPGAETPWLAELWGSSVIARLGDVWLASIHSNASPLASDRLALHPVDGILNCKPPGYWAIELVSHDLMRLVAGGRVIAGGDLNSGMLFDTRNGYDYNARLWRNLATLGFHDLRPAFFAEEQRTFFAPNRGPYQLDHLFADPLTLSQVAKWEVLLEPVDLGMSDHAPIQITLAD